VVEGTAQDGSPSVLIFPEGVLTSGRSAADCPFPLRIVSLTPGCSSPTTTHAYTRTYLTSLTRLTKASCCIQFVYYLFCSLYTIYLYNIIIDFTCNISCMHVYRTAILRYQKFVFGLGLPVLPLAITRQPAWLQRHLFPVEVDTGQKTTISPSFPTYASGENDHLPRQARDKPKENLLFNSLKDCFLAARASFIANVLWMYFLPRGQYTVRMLPPMECGKVRNRPSSSSSSSLPFVV
jgi:hypothetical protein